MVSPIPVLFDTDGGVDDSTALWYALVSPDLDLVAVTTVSGAVSAEIAAANVGRVLDAAGRADVPFALGADAPLGPAPALPPGTLMHGEDGLGNTAKPPSTLAPVAESAADFIVRICRERPGEVTIVATGPFTNLALALRAEPRLPELVKDLVAMGGVAIPPGNATAVGEFNVVVDPVAANEVATAAWTAPPRMIGLDVTLRATMTEAELGVLDARATPQAAFMADPVAHYRKTAEVESDDVGCPSHDTLAMMAVANPALFTYEELPMSVDTGASAAWGATVVDFRARWITSGKVPPEFAELAREQFFAGKGVWRIALDADIDAVRAEFRRFYGEL